MKRIIFVLFLVSFAYHYGASNPYEKKSCFSEKSIVNLMETQKTELKISENNIKYGNSLLEALPVNKLIEFSDKQQALEDKKHKNWLDQAKIRSDLRKKDDEIFELKQKLVKQGYFSQK